MLFQLKENVPVDCSTFQHENQQQRAGGCTSPRCGYYPAANRSLFESKPAHPLDLPEVFYPVWWKESRSEGR